ncbi:MAG: S8 family serine peptidase [Muribaculaceae bacterium]|nr:S8 family serine peptidase [Muribaculaceae bacterium]
MKKILMFFMVAMAATLIALADSIDKLSAGTQMFLMMHADEIQKVHPSSLPEYNGRQFKLRPEIERGVKSGFAPIEIIGNVEMIDAFIYLKNPDNVSSLESKGVIVMTKFDKFVTAKIPVDKIEEVGNLSDVIQIDVARLLQPQTDVASSMTNASKSWEGVNNGLCDNYTGQGVIVGVVDQGIHFKHTAFNDANGNTRVKRVYAPGRSSSVYTSNFPDYDVTNGSHGTHTSTTAGGGAVTLNGTTYSGMAPESDLFLCGLNSLTSTNIANSLSRIKDYATSTGQPCVVNISLGSQYGAHDGTGSLASAYSSFTSNGTAKGRILCLSAGNDAGENIYFGGTATSSTPACTSLEFNPYSDVDGSCTYTYYYSSSYYSEYYVWPRTAGTQLKFQFIIIDKKTNSVVATTNAVTPNSSSSVSLSSTYFSNGSVRITRSTDSYSGKYYYDITVQGTTTESSSSMSTTSDGKLLPRYSVGMLVFSTSNSAVQFDCWASTWSSFMDANYAGTYGNYTFAKGSDECSIGNEVATNGIITVGAYVSRKSVTTSNNVSYTSDEYTVGDIAPFSSYSTGCGPDGKVYPDITAPGAILIAGVNKYDTNNYPQSQSEAKEYMTIGNTSDGSRYGSMSGTSMSAPTTTGIMALWLQANPNLSVNDVKEVLNQTAVRDSYVTGANSAHFGKYGKIDALNGLKYIAPCEDDPIITVSPTSINFGNVTAGGTATQTFNVQGANLEGDISLTVSGTGYSISQATVYKNTAENGTGATITVTFNPTANVSNTYNGTITLASSNATNVIVSLSGNGVYTAPSITASPTSLSFTGNSGQTYTKTVTVTGNNLQGEITAAITNDANGIYSVSPSSFDATSQVVTVTWTPTAGGTSTANLVLTTIGAGANTVTIPITGTAQGPTITANPTSVTFTDAYATRTYTQTVTVTGSNLSQNITASLTGANVYSIDNSSLNNSGGTITVTYAPTVAGNTEATLTLSSAGASSVTVNITGTAQAAIPTLIVEPTSLAFSSDLENSVTKTFAVTGRFINEAVNVELTGANDVFTVSPTTIPANSISEDNPVNVTVTFQSTNEGSFTGTITLACAGVEPKTVTLTAFAHEGGTASDNYLNIAKYATIDEAGWNTSYVNYLYKYTEHINEECAWLTLPVYGAWSACYYNEHPQKWIETNVDNTNNKYAGTTWGNSAELLGSSSYFTSTTARGMGYNSRTNTTQETFSFYVTNTTGVKLLGLGQSRADSNYPASLKVYECTKNADGTLTASTAAIKNESNFATSGTFVLSATDLDESMIYKVEAATYRSYICEIGFQTPLNKPTLKVTPNELSMRAAPGEIASATFNVNGHKLTDNVSVTLSDLNSLFSIDQSIISVADAESGASVTVTFNAPVSEGVYSGTITLTSGELMETVVISGICREGGTANDAYLNIAKYATIDDAGWRTALVDNIYKYTEYYDNDVAWLTMPVYGAFVGARYAINSGTIGSGHPQAWIECSLSNNNTYGGTTWSFNPSYSDPYNGSGTYFTNTTSRALGYNSSRNSEIRNISFYVTNVTAVKLYGIGIAGNYMGGGSSDSYPAAIKIYECTENSDGTLNAATTATATQISGSTSTYNIAVTDLNANKIYKVEVSNYRGYMYEIGFQTPLTTTTATLAQIESSGAKNQKFMISDELVAVYTDADNGLLWCKDEGNSSIVATSIIDGQIDFMRDVNINYDNETQTHNGQVGDWDQSNWIVLKFPEATANNGIAELLNGAVENNKKIAARTVSGRYIDNENYTIEVFPKNGEYTLSFTDDSNYTMNVYSPANFIESNLNINGNTGAVGVHGDHYFFMNPKIQEVCEITYAMWDGEMFVTPDNTEIQGALNVSWERNTTGGVKPSLKEGQNYRFIAVVSRPSKLNVLRGGGDPSDNYVVYPANLSGDGNIVTAINGVYMNSNCEVVGVDYVNTAGMISDKPFQGINIVVTRYSDGSKTATKKVFK